MYHSICKHAFSALNFMFCLICIFICCFFFFFSCYCSKWHLLLSFNILYAPKRISTPWHHLCNFVFGRGKTIKLYIFLALYLQLLKELLKTNFWIFFSFLKPGEHNKKNRFLWMLTFCVCMHECVLFVFKLTIYLLFFKETRCWPEKSAHPSIFFLMWDP